MIEIDTAYAQGGVSNRAPSLTEARWRFVCTGADLNASFARDDDARRCARAIEAVGAEVRYLPPYSPDLNRSSSCSPS